MSFSYQYGQNPAIDFPRLLISDTLATNHIFEDAEIMAATNITANIWQSAQFYTPPSGVGTLPTTPISYYRIAALLLDSIAANKARLASITQILDVKLDPSKAAKALQDQARAYREIDDNSGAFVLIEQVNDNFSFYDRFWKQIQRQSAGTLG
jgi:hypothetical protein